MRALPWIISLELPLLDGNPRRAWGWCGLESSFSFLLGFPFCERYFGEAVLDGVEADPDSGRDCCGACFLATWAAVVVDTVAAGLVDLAVGAAALVVLAVGVPAAAGRVAVGSRE